MIMHCLTKVIFMLLSGINLLAEREGFVVLDMHNRASGKSDF